MRGGRWGVCARLALALLGWGALFALATSRLQSPPPQFRPAHPALLALQHKLAAANDKPATDDHVLNEDEMRAEAERRLPSLPFAYWHKHKYDTHKYYQEKDCAPFPSIYDLEFHNTYWQTLRTANGTFYLYGAYMDARNASPVGPAVRVLVVHDRISPTLASHCQLWFEDRNAPVVVPNLGYEYMWNSAWGNYCDYVLQPYLMTCVLPEEVHHLVPASVSLVERPCDRAINNLRVHYDRPPAGRKDFAVCVKGLDFYHKDFSVRLVEWIELIRLMGADKVFFYEYQVQSVHPNMTKVLAYYAAQGVVTVTPISLPGGQPNVPGLQHMYFKRKRQHKQQMEMIPYNDCLYRHLYEYRWLALLDVDEVIVPVEDGDWRALMQRVRSLTPPGRSSYHARNLYFLDSQRDEHGYWEQSVPRHLHMLQHVYRTLKFTKPGDYVKAFHDTDRVLTVHNHLPMACLDRACISQEMETGHARLHHYRADCATDLVVRTGCAELRAHTVRDTALWRWREPLVARTDAALRALAFLPPRLSCPSIFLYQCSGFPLK